jgi:hypothetical protein
MIGSLTRGRLFLPTALIVGCLSCATSPPAPLSPLQLAGANAKTIVVAPINVALALPEELTSSTEIVLTALVENLRKHGKTVHLVDFRNGRMLWLESAREVGQSDIAKSFNNAARVFAEKLRENVDFDALIIPSLYLQNAKVHADGSARWDGARQRIDFVGQSKWKVDLPPLAIVPAASILLSVFDREGNPLHSKRTGLELIQHLEIQSKRRKGHDERSWALVDDTPAIEDAIRVSASIAHTLSPFLPKETR